MSVNNLISTEHVVSLKAVQERLQVFLSRWQAANTLEQRQLIEGAAVTELERLINFDYDMQRVYAGQPLFQEEMADAYTAYQHMLVNNLSKLRKLAEELVRCFNTQQLANEQIAGQIARIRQKRGALTLWSSLDNKFLLSEQFYNLDHLLTEITTDALYINTQERIATLPVISSKLIKIKKLSLGEKSNGQPGNSDTLVTTNNTQPDFAINNEPNDWFEYERLDSGPCVLQLVIEFSKTEVVNQFIIDAMDFANISNGVKIIDCVFINESSRSIFDLQSNKELFAKTNELTEVSFLPIFARSVVLTLEQSVEHMIDTPLGMRKRWAIGLRLLSFKQIEYAESGVLNSKPAMLPGGLYSGISELDIFGQPDFFETKIESTTDGKQWFSSTHILDGASSNFNWRFMCKRLTSQIASASSIYMEDVKQEISTASRLINPLINPTVLKIPDITSNAWAYQSKLVRRDNQSKFDLGKTNGSALNLRLPFDVEMLELDELTVYVNNQAQAVVSSSPDAGEWCYTSDRKEIQLPAIAAGANVQLGLKPEIVVFNEELIHRTDLPFDIDLKTISLEYLTGSLIAGQYTIPLGKKLIRLPVKHIKTLELDNNWTAVENRGALASSTYLLDSINGILELYAGVSEQVIVTYTAYMVKSTDQFLIHFESNMPAGIKLKSDSFEAISNTYFVDEDLPVVYDFSTGIEAARVEASSNTKTVLPHQRIVPGSLTVRNLTSQVVSEVPFVDGRSEFLNLISVTEQTVETTVSSPTQVVNFTLAAGAYVETEPVFGSTMFATKVGSSGLVNSTGKYAIDLDTGIVTVYVGSGGTLPGGIYVQYSYYDPTADYNNRYSVDYVGGRVYTYANQLPGAKITYKYYNYLIKYDVVKYLPINIKEAIEIDTTDALNLKQVKIAWLKTSKSNESVTLAKYWTPFINKISYRFN